MTVHVTHNSGNNEWYTPQKYITAARIVMGSIDLDPASSAKANEIVCASHYYDIAYDGLAHDWFGNVWMNPPYARHLIGRFCEKLIVEVNAGRVKQAITLTNNATETVWFRKLALKSSAICLPKGRIKFIDGDGNATGAPLQGQALLYIGPASDKFRRVFFKLGLVYVR